MSTPFTIKYCLSPPQRRKMPRNLRVKIMVSWSDTTLHRKVFFYCLHCRMIFCRSGLYYHQQTFFATQEMRREWVADFLNNQNIHQTRVRRQFEKRFVRGRMVGGVVAETYPDDHFVPMNPQRTEPRQPSVTGSRPRVQPREPDQTPLEHVDLVQPVPNENEDEIINNLPELFDCFQRMGLTRNDSNCLPDFS